MKRAMGIIAILLIIGGVVFAWRMFTKPKAAAEAGEPVLLARIDAGSKSDFFAGGGKDGVFVADKDGARFFAADGAQTMNRQFEMKNPRITAAGGYVAVYEPGGVNIYVCGQSAAGYSATAAAPIYNASVNRRGWLCLLMDSGGAERYAVYNYSGSLILEGEFNDTRLIPVCAAVSEDGRIAAVAFADTSATAVSSCVNFYYINRNESGGFDNGLFAFSGDYPGRLIGDMTFFGEELICVASDALMWFSTVKNDLEKREAATNGRVTAISVEDGHAAVAVDSGAVYIYDSKLALRGTYEAGVAVSFLACGHGGLIVGGAGAYTAVTYSGEERWSKDVTADIKKAFYISAKTVALCGAGAIYTEEVR